LQPIGVEVYSEDKESDSVKVALNGRQYFEKTKNLILIDTAGRHKEEKGLLDEMTKIVSKVKPDFSILVVDGTVGQQIYNQALAFHQTAPVGGVIITKLDGAAKGGGALAASTATGARVLFIGTGERVDDLEEFVPTRFVGRLLGMGDLKSLMDMAKDLEGGVDEKAIQRITSGKLTMNDFLYQFEQVNKMGSLKKIIELIPGVSDKLKSEDLEKTEASIKVWKSVIHSMSKEEREAPDKLNASRIKRIAMGSGRREKDVRDLLSRYKQTKTMMKASKGREFRQLMRRMGGQTGSA
jgi:signal recognition particle subunit SRP54